MERIDAGFASTPNRPLTGIDKVTSTLVQGLKNKDPEKRRLALISLTNIFRGYYDEAEKIAGSPIQNKEKLLESLKNQIKPILTKLINDENEEVRSHVYEQLVHVLGEESVPDLVKALDDPKNKNIKYYIISALERTGTKNVEAIRKLTNLAKNDPEPTVRRAAIDALARTAGLSAYQTLIDALNDKDFEVKGHAASALGTLKDPRAIPNLVYILNDEELDNKKSPDYAFGFRGRAAIALADLKAIKHLKDIYKAIDSGNHETASGRETIRDSIIALGIFLKEKTIPQKDKNEIISKLKSLIQDPRYKDYSIDIKESFINAGLKQQ